MAYGIQITTTDGVQSDLNFQAARFVARISVDAANDPIDIPAPAGAVIGQSIIFRTTPNTLSQPHVITENATLQQIEIRLRAGYNFNQGQSNAYAFFFLNVT